MRESGVVPSYPPIDKLATYECGCRDKLQESRSLAIDAPWSLYKLGMSDHMANIDLPYFSHGIHIQMLLINACERYHRYKLHHS